VEPVTHRLKRLRREGGGKKSKRVGACGCDCRGIKAEGGRRNYWNSGDTKLIRQKDIQEKKNLGGNTRTGKKKKEKRRGVVCGGRAAKGGTERLNKYFRSTTNPEGRGGKILLSLEGGGKANILDG